MAIGSYRSKVVLQKKRPIETLRCENGAITREYIDDRWLACATAFYFVRSSIMSWHSSSRQHSMEDRPLQSCRPRENP